MFGLKNKFKEGKNMDYKTRRGCPIEVGCVYMCDWLDVPDARNRIPQLLMGPHPVLVLAFNRVTGLGTVVPLTSGSSKSNGD